MFEHVPKDVIILKILIINPIVTSIRVYRNQWNILILLQEAYYH